MQPEHGCCIGTHTVASTTQLSVCGGRAAAGGLRLDPRDVGLVLVRRRNFAFRVGFFFETFITDSLTENPSVPKPTQKPRLCSTFHSLHLAMRRCLANSCVALRQAAFSNGCRQLLKVYKKNGRNQPIAQTNAHYPNHTMEILNARSLPLTTSFA